jgi:hypothetical protein
MQNSEVIQFVGIKDLEDTQKDLVNKLSTEYYEKIKRKVKNLTNLIVHIKVYSKGGESKKYSLHVRCIAPTHVFESCKSHDFDLATGLHKSFEDIIHQIDHTFHTDVSRPTP